MLLFEFLESSEYRSSLGRIKSDCMALLLREAVINVDVTSKRVELTD